MMKTYEVVIERSAVLTVQADDEQGAYEAATGLLEGSGGYSEYQCEGWEIVPELINELKEAANITTEIQEIIK